MHFGNGSTLYGPGRASAGDRLRFMLRSRGLSVSSLAQSVGVSRQAVYGWMKRGTISAEYLEPISTVLGVTSQWLMFGSESGSERPEDAACHETCNLKATVLDFLVKRHRVALEHDYSIQALRWHGSPDVLFGSDEPPASLDGLLAMADASYRSLIHHGIVEFHLTAKPRLLFFPLHTRLSESPTWVSIHLYARCGRHGLLYGLSPVGAFRPAGG